MAEISSLGIDGAWLYTTEVHEDSRGSFSEWFKSDLVEKKLYRKFVVAQSNISKSKKGVVRGIHLSTAPEGQAKWVTCTNGSIWDVIVDLRPDSPTFKKWVSHELKAGQGESIFIEEGLGHAFLALEDDSIVCYLTTSLYQPKLEISISPQDPTIAIFWPKDEIRLSEKDKNAMPLSEYLRIY
jgi:dTDP-4-dehydrorhamnose 3,5-epimerase